MPSCVKSTDFTQLAYPPPLHASDGPSNIHSPLIPAASPALPLFAVITTPIHLSPHRNCSKTPSPRLLDPPAVKREALELVPFPYLTPSVQCGGSHCRTLPGTQVIYRLPLPTLRIWPRAPVTSTSFIRPRIILDTFPIPPGRYAHFQRKGYAGRGGANRPNTELDVTTCSLLLDLDTMQELPPGTKNFNLQLRLIFGHGGGGDRPSNLERVLAIGDLSNSISIAG